jgi:hypothetical protein
MTTAVTREGLAALRMTFGLKLCRGGSITR